jgi:hypothetical protein
LRRFPRPSRRNDGSPRSRSSSSAFAASDKATRRPHTVATLAADVHTVLWTSGDLRCVLVTRHDPKTLAVQVFNGENAFISEPVDDPDEAAAVAERLWTTLVESRR